MRHTKHQRANATTPSVTAFGGDTSLGEGGLSRPPPRGGCHEVTGGVRAAQQAVITMDTARMRRGGVVCMICARKLDKSGRKDDENEL